MSQLQSLDEYAINRFTTIFDSVREHCHEDNYHLAIEIVNSMKDETSCDYDQFKLLFWKILSNVSDKLRSKEKCNRTLTELLVNHRWSTPLDFIRATHDDLDSDNALFRRNIRMNVFRRIEFMNKWNNENTEHHEGLLECPKCKSKNTDFLTLQTSRGDEGSTIRAVCLDCSKRWKFR